MHRIMFMPHKNLKVLVVQIFRTVEQAKEENVNDI